MIERATAYKLGIGKLMRGEWKEDRMFVNNAEILRVRIMGNVVQKYVSDDKNYGFLVIDDETGTIRVRVFREDLRLMNHVRLGDIVETIGKLKKYNDEVYISPEINRRIFDPNMYFLRKIELFKEFKPQDVEVAEEYTMDGKEKEKMLKLIEEIDKGEGAFFDEIVEKIKMGKKDVETILYNLLKDGYVYEPRQRRYRVL